MTIKYYSMSTKEKWREIDVIHRIIVSNYDLVLWFIRIIVSDYSLNPICSSFPHLHAMPMEH